MMDKRDNFYLTLLSDSSMSNHPENVTSSFVVDLPKTINLSGEWEAALTSLHYPKTIQNISPNNNSLVVTFERISKIDGSYLGQDIHAASIPVGHYETIDSVLKALNCVVDELSGYEATEPLFCIDDNENNMIQVKNENLELFRQSFTPLINLKKTLYPGEDIKLKKIHLEPRLALMLGYDPLNHNFVNFCSPLHKYNVNAGFAQNLFVYCDLIEGQIIGHRYAPVMKIIPAIEHNATYGESILRTFPTREYLPLAKRSFNAISLNILDNTGQRIPFTCGQLIVTVHLRRKKARNYNQNEF
jgi:hypothetical protein